MRGDDERPGDEICALTISTDAIRSVLDAEARRRVQETPRRQLRMAELGAYSGTLSLEFLNHGWHGVAYEREKGTPVFDAFRQAGFSTRKHIKLSDIKDLTSLEEYDYVHISLNCTSNTIMAQSIHRRNEANGFDGESIEAAEFNRLLKHCITLLSAAKLKNQAFAFTFEQPKSVARQNMDIQRWFEKEDSSSACPAAPPTGLLPCCRAITIPLLACCVDVRSLLHALHLQLVQVRQPRAKADGPVGAQSAYARRLPRHRGGAQIYLHRGGAVLAQPLPRHRPRQRKEVHRLPA